MNHFQPIAAHLLRHLHDQPDAAALMCRIDGAYRNFTWQQLAADVSQCVEHLQRLGIRQGDHVVQRSGNRYRWVAVDFALQFLRAVHVPVNPRRSRQQFDEIVTHCQAALVIDEHFAWTGYGPSTDSVKQLAELAGEIAADDLMSVLYTSGTVSQPKGVMLSQRNFAANVNSLLQVSPVRGDETRLCLLPLSHVFARTNDLYASIAGGCCLAISDSPQEIFRELAEVRPTFFNGVPYLFEKCVAELHRRGTQSEPTALRELLGGRIEAVNCGGAAIPTDVEDYFWERDVPMLTGYGLTETSPVLSASTIDAHQRQCVGKPIPGLQIKIAEDGEILAAGENVMQGYYRDASATRVAIRDGWFHTGDIGSLKDDGSLQISGRKQEMIVTSAGHNIFPAEIEKLIDAHSLVERSCVIGNGLPYLIALVALCDHSPIISHSHLLTEICENMSHLAAHQQIGSIIVLPDSLTVEAGLLTEKGGLCRDAIRARYDDLIESAKMNRRC